jgi:hypothetical protein
MSAKTQSRFTATMHIRKNHASVPLRPQELPFTAEERGSVTILFGGLTWKHERLIEGLLAGAGYLCQHLPETDRDAHELAQEYCASGMCNPVDFTVGNLLRYLRRLQDSGLSAEQIVKKYVYFTAVVDAGRSALEDGVQP